MSDLVPFKLLSAITVLDSSMEGWKLLEVPATATRVHRCPVRFEQPFAASPVVQIGIVALDLGHQDNVRVRVRALDVQPDGFILHAETWFNTQVWCVEISWLAIGA